MGGRGRGYTFHWQPYWREYTYHGDTHITVTPGGFFMSRNYSFVGTWCVGTKNDCQLTFTAGKECDGILWSFLHKFKV